MQKKRRPIRTIVKILLYIILVLVVLIFVLPLVFKGRIMEEAKVELNKQLNAEVDFADFNMSLIRSFPHFYFHLDELSVVGKDDFQGDTLASVSSVAASIDLLSVISGETYKIRRISIIEPDIYLKVLKNEKVNWDIVKESEEPEVEVVDEEPSAFRISLKKFEIKEGNLKFDDMLSGFHVEAGNMNYDLSGDFTVDRTTLSMKSKIDELTLSSGGIDYLQQTVLDLRASIDADLKNNIYTFRQNRIKLNELILEFDGSASLIGEDISLMLTFVAPQNKFRNFLSMIPAIYARDFQDIETEGLLALDGYIKGVYNDEKYPSFGLNIKVDDAMFKYPDLPAQVDDVNINAMIMNPGGDLNNTEIKVEKLHFSMLDNPVDIKLIVKDPMEDMYLDGHVKGVVDLSSIDRVYPLEEGEKMNGLLNANIILKGRLSSIENEEYEKFTAMGSLVLNDLNYKSADFEQDMLINNAQLNFSPEYLDLVGLDYEYGSSDVKAKGKVYNYLGYVLHDKLLKGNLNITSTLLNINEFLAGSDEEKEAGPGGTTELAAFKVPANIDFEMTSKFDKLIYEEVELDNVSGKIIVRDEKINMQGLSAGIFNGNITLNGYYSTRDTINPEVNLDLDISRLNIIKAYEVSGVVQRLAPIAEHVTGDFSTKLEINTLLNQDMEPVWSSMFGNGDLSTSSLKLENVKVMNNLSSTLKIEELQEISLKGLRMIFEIDKGKVNVKPFNFNFKGIEADVSGWTSFDQTIEYTMEMKVPRKLFGDAANDVLDNLASKANVAGKGLNLGETIDLDVLIQGTTTDPVIKTNLAGMGKDLIEDTKQQIEEELKKKKEEAEKKAKEEAEKILADARARADKILQEAQMKSDEIMKAARAAAEKTRNETDKQAQKIIDEGKKKGVLAEAAAKKTAEEFKKEGYKKADQIIAEAQQQSDNIMKTARQRADKIMNEAREKVQ